MRCTSRTPSGPALHRTRRISSSALVGRTRVVAMARIVDEDLRHCQTKVFVIHEKVVRTAPVVFILTSHMSIETLIYTSHRYRRRRPREAIQVGLFTRLPRRSAA